MKKTAILIRLLALVLAVILGFTSCDMFTPDQGGSGIVDDNSGVNTDTDDKEQNGEEDKGTQEGGNNLGRPEGDSGNTPSDTPGGSDGFDGSGDIGGNTSGDNSEDNKNDENTSGGSTDGDSVNKNDKPSINGGKNINVGGVIVPEYSGNPFYVINNNVPSFEASELVTNAYEIYGQLDSLGRCTYAMACIDRSLMPPEDDTRGSLNVDPTGWNQQQYDVVPGKYLYNRSHLIGWQLTDEDSNKQNLITGTRYMNASGMLPFENMVADYIKETNNHVIYRVTPIFEGDNLLASGVHIEAYSVEDNGYGISINVFVYNVQPDIGIDYATGESWLNNGKEIIPEEDDGTPKNYILNTSSLKIHECDCSAAQRISEANKQEYTGELDPLYEQGYTKCGICNPT